MKLKEIQGDVLSVAKQLEEKYNTSVLPELSLNPDNIGEIILSFKMKVMAPLATTTAVEPEVVTPAEVVESIGFAEAIKDLPEKKKRGRKAKAQ